MPDEEKGGDKGADDKGGEGEKNEDGTPKKVEKRGCCDKFSECLVLSFQKTAKCINKTCAAIG
jgi:hypothetical protein